MKTVIKSIVLISILSMFSCESPSLENETGIIEQLNDEYSTDPGEDLEPGGSGGGSDSDKEDL